jgi:aspartate aminotransferase
VARHISISRGVSVGPERVVVTPGAKPIIFFSLLACVEEGDEVIYPDTGFPIYRSVIDFLKAKPVPIRVREELGFSIDVDEFASLLTDRTRFVILNSPHNPTGGMLDRAQVRRLAELLRERDLFVLSDEVYSRILYEGEHHSILAEPGMLEKTILLDGHSKTFAMTGWRLGYGVMPAELAVHVTRLMTNSNSCTNVFVQRAGIAALEGPQEIVEERNQEFRRRRDVIVEGLNRIPGVRCTRPQGAFYVLPNVQGTGLDCRALAKRLLDEAGVAALSGTSFGEFGAGYLRFSYANSVENIREALDRMAKFLGH